MALTNSQYDAIMRTYDQKQLKAYNDANGRLLEIYAKIPEYAHLNEQIASLSLESAKGLLRNADTPLDDIYEKIDALSDKKRSLLTKAGLPEDYAEPHFECSDCQDTGFLRNGRKCHCFMQQEINILYRQSNISGLLDTDNFDNLSYDFYEGEDLEKFKNAVNICHNFIDNFPKDYDKRDYANILFYGTVGTGKSFLTGCIAKDLLDKGFSVIYFSAIELFELLSDVMFRNGENSALRSERAELYECDLLIIDDLGTEFTNNAVALQLFSLLNERHILRKSIIISTNMSIEELQERYADRIFSRIIERYKFIKLTGPDVRRIKKLKS